MWSALSKTLKLMVIMVLVVLGLSFAGVMSLVLKSCDDDNSKSCLTTKKDLRSLATKEDLDRLSANVLTTRGLKPLENAANQAKNAAIDAKDAAEKAATKDDLKPLKEAIARTATKEDLLATCTRDATAVAQPDPPKVTTPPPAVEPPKPAPIKPARRASKPKQVAPTTDPALERRVSNLETRMARQEYLTKPLSEYADKHREKYLERARARLEALDRLPDKVQGESK